MSTSQNGSASGTQYHIAADMSSKKGRRATPLRRRQRYGVSPEQFALTWNSCQSADEASDKLKMPKPIVLARVSNYRRKGINLKKMPRKNARKVDVEALNRLLAEHRQGAAEALPLVPVPLHQVIEKVATQVAEAVVQKAF